jgi:FkbM family methyltransferase
MAKPAASDPISILQTHQLPATRLGRFLRAPVKTSVVRIARELGVRFPVETRTFSGAVFKGLVPEAVTSAIWRFGFHERLTSLFILKRLREGSCFIDIGAHFGYYTILASKIAGGSGRVVAIEPIPETFAALQTNIVINHLENVKTYQVAAFSTDDCIPFIDFGIINSALNTRTRARGLMEGKEHTGNRIMVAARRADDIVKSLNIETVHLIKIDAESGEEEVLNGLSDTIGRDRPSTIVEMGGVSAEEEESRIGRIFSFMKEFGYRGFTFDGQNLTEIRDTHDLPYLNVIFEADR